MSVINSIPLIAAGDDGYQISRSVRLRSSASAYLNRTPASATNRRTFTWSGWVKRGASGDGTGSNHFFLFTAGTSTAFCAVDFYQNNIRLNFGNGTYLLVTSSVYRDYSSWYHIVVSVDTTQTTDTNRVKLYINGTQVTAFSTAIYPIQNYDTAYNNTVAQRIAFDGGSNYFDGYLTEVNFIDGQALTPSSFGETNAVTGVWQPKKYAGTYGTNGFYLNFSDNSAATAAAIGKDYSGNGNNWTPNNISVTAGVTYDSMIDTPTPYADGGNGRGNYAVMNPLDKHASLPAPTNGNLSLSNAASAWFAVRSTVAVTSGKWYAEITQTGSNSFAGVMSGSSALTFASKTGSTGIYGFFNDGAGTSGYPYSNGTSGTVFTIASGDVIGLAYDYDAQTVVIYRNGSLQATVTSVPKAEPMFFCAAFAQTSATHSWNFGQRPFAYTPPTGFNALNTQNLPDSTIPNGAAYMAATTYTATPSTGATISNAVNGVSFQPDFLWVKNRDNVEQHYWQDSVRGFSPSSNVTKMLNSNSTAAESSLSDITCTTTSSGFTVVDSSPGTGEFWYTNRTYVAWQWNAGGSTVTNTSGTISSQVRANATAGFSIVTYTGTGANATVGHGLGVAPRMIIVKNRSAVSSWMIAVDYSGFTWSSDYFQFDTGAKYTNGASTIFRQAPTSTVFSVGTNSNINGSTNNLVAYCFSAVAGYSAFGSYTGNGSTDGPFVYLGFRPRFLMIKASSGTGDWGMYDTTRSTYNDTIAGLQANLSNSESSPYSNDILSNGFKPRRVAYINDTGVTYIYMAFAENPFKYSLGR